MHKTALFRPLLILAVAIATVIALGACAPIAYDRDDSVNISPDATVAFAGGKWQEQENPDPAVDDDTVHRHIQNAIAAQLQSRGFTLTGEQETADFLVRYFIGLRREATPVNATGSLARATPAARPGWGWGWGAGTVTTLTPRDFAEDSIVVELVERSTGRSAWRAVWRGEPDARAPTREAIDDKMEQIFRSAPNAG
jgi:hypothetical protein